MEITEQKKSFWNFSESNKGKYEGEEGVKQMQEKILEYFTEGRNIRKVYDSKLEKIVEIPVITITGLSLYLGFCSRQSFYDYESKELFSYTIKKARTFLEMEYEEMLQSGNHTAAIFALKNFGWKDIQTFEGEVNDNGDKKFIMEFQDAEHSNIDDKGNIVE